MDKHVYIHNIKLEGEDRWAKAFNECSELWQKAKDSTLLEEERKNAWVEFIQKRQCLELGMY